jgi:peptide-methionine (S)-S-oxide reductase
MVPLSRWIAAIVIVLGSTVLFLRAVPTVPAAEEAVVISAPLVDNPKAPGPLQTAVLAGGCFWGVQGVYQHVRGVRQVLSGYSGGTKETRLPSQ